METFPVTIKMYDEIMDTVEIPEIFKGFVVMRSSAYTGYMYKTPFVDTEAYLLALSTKQIEGAITTQEFAEAIRKYQEVRRFVIEENEKRKSIPNKTRVVLGVEFA